MFKFVAIILLIFTGTATTAWPADEPQPIRGINATVWYTWPRFEGWDKPGVIWPPFPSSKRMPAPADFEQLKSLGFMSLRLGVDPALFIGLEGKKRDLIKGRIMTTVKQAVDQGLDVVFDLHPNSRHKVYGQSAYASLENNPNLAPYIAVVGEIAQDLSEFPKGRVALELMNEPRSKCSGGDQERWEEFLDAMIAEASKRAPGLPLVISGSCTSSIEGLLALKPGRWARKDLLFTFHFYEPFPFTHQSAPFIPWPEKYLSGLPWPPQERTDEGVIIEAAKDRIDRIRMDNRAEAEAGAARVLARYLSSGTGIDGIRERLQSVADWADENGVPRRNIYLGEFGVYRDEFKKEGASCADRAAWVRDVRSVTSELGFSWSFFHLDGAFGVLVGPARKPDRAVLKSLGLSSDGKCP